MTLSRNLSTLGQAVTTTGNIPLANVATSIASGTLLKSTGSGVTSASAAEIVAAIGSTEVTNATNATTASNGGVTSLNGQTGSITNTSIDAIGSVIIAVNGITVSDGTILTSIGTTYSGSSLRYITNRSSSFIDPISGSAAYAYAPTCTYQGGGTSLSGTWRAMSASKAIYQSDGWTFYWYTALFVRVS